jgi:hypothetical protein
VKPWKPQSIGMGRVQPARTGALKVEGEPVEFLADWDRLSQILDNLLASEFYRV